jgi:hypothetical protein
LGKTAVWWASGQSGIHRDIQFDIQFQLDLGKIPCSTPLRQAWHYLFEAWEQQKNEFNLDFHELKSLVALDGWTNATVRKFGLHHRPYLTAERHWSKPRPPTKEEVLQIRDLLKLDVKYPDHGINIKIPDEFLVPIVREFRQNLEYAVSLEKELGGYGLEMLASLEPDPDLKGDSYGRTYGISGGVLKYVSLFKKMADLDTGKAKMEALAWPTDDDTVFALLRIWGCGDVRIFSGVEAGEIIYGLDDRTFWRGRHQRDFLLTVAKRWAEFPPEARRQLGIRLLKGPSRWDQEDDNEYNERCAWSALNRIQWLKSHRCEFEFDFDRETTELRRRAPKWRPEYAEKAAASMDGRGGWVQKNTEYATLLAEPLSNLLKKAKELSGRTEDFLMETDPYAGLSLKRPVRAFTALTHASKHGDYPEWAWKTFLNGEGRKSDKPKFAALIAERVSRLPRTILVQLIYTLCEWLLKSSGVLLRKYPKQFESVWETLVSVIKFNSEHAHSAIISGSREPDWVMEALNSPAGKLAEALMNDPQTNDLNFGCGFPPTWISRVSQLLSLDEDLHAQTLATFARRLNWFFAIDSSWTEKNLLSALEIDGDDRNAVWAGFFSQAKVPNPKLYLQLKPQLLELTRRKSTGRHHHVEMLAGILLWGWINKDTVTGARYITDKEMRDVLITVDDDFRSQTLWQLERWSSDEEEKKTWAQELPVFLTHVWPRQRSVKCSRITASLCDLAFSDVATFPERIDLILPLVTTLDHNYTGLHQLEDNIVAQYPKNILELLFVVLPENAAEWPYGSGELLESVANADTSLLTDTRLVELKRRWNSR